MNRALFRVCLVHMPCVDSPAPTNRFVVSALNKTCSPFDVAQSYSCIVIQPFKYITLPVPRVFCSSTHCCTFAKTNERTSLNFLSTSLLCRHASHYALRSYPSYRSDSDSLHFVYALPLCWFKARIPRAGKPSDCTFIQYIFPSRSTTDTK
jgi:hypothetical protein